MSLLLRPRSATSGGPAIRPRTWYALLFKLYQPRDGRLSQADAAALIEANWHRSYKEIKADGPTLPG